MDAKLSDLIDDQKMFANRSGTINETRLQEDLMASDCQLVSCLA